MNEWRDDLRLAVAMLTRIPMPHPDGASPAYVARAPRVFPVIGAAIGGAIGLVYLALLGIGIPVAATAALALGAGMLLTGGFHEDGLADLADGFGGGRDKTAKLDIMRDSRLGTYGALVLLVTFAAKLSALTSLPSSSVVVSLIAAHALSRAPLSAVALYLPSARADGLAAAAGKIVPQVAAIAAISGLVIVLVCLPVIDALLATAVAAGAAVVVATLAKRQIGGYTGDVLGATQQIAETAVLLLLAVRHG